MLKTNQNGFYKKTVSFLFLFMLVSASLFAQIVPPGMTNLLDSIFEALTGGIATAVFGLCLVGCAIGYAFSKDSQKMKTSAIAIGISIAVVATASHIVKAVMEASK